MSDAIQPFRIEIPQAQGVGKVISDGGWGGRDTPVMSG